MSVAIFLGVVDNPIGEITTWRDHQKLAVCVWACRFNGNLVTDHVRIVQLSEDDVSLIERDGEAVDVGDFEGTEIATNGRGARALAKLLIEAADKADAVAALCGQSEAQPGGRA